MSELNKLIRDIPGWGEEGREGKGGRVGGREGGRDGGRVERRK